MKKQKPVAWARLAARMCARDGLTHGWPTEKGLKTIENEWGEFIEYAYSFHESKLWKDLNLHKTERRRKDGPKAKSKSKKT